MVFPLTLKLRTSRVIGSMKKSKVVSSSVFSSQLAFTHRKWTSTYLEVKYFGPSKRGKTPNSEKDKYSLIKLHSFCTIFPNYSTITIYNTYSFFSQTASSLLKHQKSCWHLGQFHLQSQQSFICQQ